MTSLAARRTFRTTSSPTRRPLAALVVAALALLVAVLVIGAASPSDADVGDVLTVEAEDFTAGAYNDTQAGNQGNSNYRAGQDVDVWLASGDAGNHVIGTTRDGEWAEYDVTVADSGSYRVNLRLASGRANPGSISVSIDGDAVGELDFENTGTWWNWQTPDLGTASLSAGSHTVRVSWIGEANINFDRFTLTQVAAADGECPSLTVQAETADITGSMRVGSGAGAIGGAYITTSNGGGASAPNLSYAELCVSVPTAGRYQLDGRVQNTNDRDDSFWVSIDRGGAALWDTAITNGWTTDPVRARSIANPAVWELDAGDHTIRVSAREDGAKLDQLTLTSTTLPASNLGDGPGIEPTPAPTPPSGVRTPAAANVVPGRLQAELFDFGTSADPAYSDTDAANVGGAFRTDEAVDIWNTFGEDGQVVGRTRGGEYVEFTVFPEQAGTYEVTARVASGISQPGSISVTTGSEQAGPATIVARSWWSFEEIVLGTIELGTAPSQIVRLNWLGNGNINTDWIQLSLVDGVNPPDPVITPEPIVTPGPYVNDPQQSPYGNEPIAIPGRIDAENYDRGGAGVAWNDASAANDGNSDFRVDEGVDVGHAVDPFGRFVGWLADGDWTEYTIDADEAVDGRMLTLFSRVASADPQPGSMLVSINGTPMATIDIPATGGWQNWQTVSMGNFTVPSGPHTVRLTAIDGARFNINFVRFDIAIGATPYRDHVAPGLIQLEDFDFGNRRVGYNDTDTENLGGEYRWESVDLYQSNDGDGSYYVGDNGNGEWLNYTFTAPQAGDFDLHVRAASADGTNQPVELLIDDQPVDTLNFSATSWATKTSAPVSLTSGEHVLRVRMPEGTVNLNWLYIADEGATFTAPTALSGTVQVAPEDDLGMLAVRSAPGTIFEILPGTHTFDHVFAKDDQKFIGVGALGDAKLFGDGVRNPAFAGLAEGVEIRNLDISGYGTGLFVGTISARNNDDFGDVGPNWIVEGNRIHDNDSVGVNLSPGMQVLNNEIYENGQIGISGVGRDITRLPDVLVEGNDIHHNGPEESGMLPFNFHEGGMKTTFSDRLVVRNNNFHDNYGVGLYCDLHCDDILYEDNELTNNIGPNHAGGIFFEWSTNGIIRNNTIVNRSANPLRDVVYGIRTGESQDVDIVNNDITMGVGPALDVRSCCAVEDDPSFERIPSARVTFRNNTVTSTDAGTRIHTVADQAAFTGNIYRNGNGQIRFYRGSSQRSWAQWQAAGQDTTGQFTN